MPVERREAFVAGTVPQPRVLSLEPPRRAERATDLALRPQHGDEALGDDHDREISRR